MMDDILVPGGVSSEDEFDTKQWNKEKSGDPFVFLDSIMKKENYIDIDANTKKGYNSFVINRGLSNYEANIYHTEMMNYNHHLPVEIQYDYYFLQIPKPKYYKKWAKKSNVTDLQQHILDSIAQEFNYGPKKVKTALKLLSVDEIIEIGSHYWMSSDKLYPESRIKKSAIELKAS